jgi:hypothetical protein
MPGKKFPPPYPRPLPRHPDKLRIARFTALLPDTIKNAITWNKPAQCWAGLPVKFPDWSLGQKDHLAIKFYQISNRSTYPELPEVPPVDVFPADVLLTETGTVRATLLDPASAWEYYIAYLAQTLHVELSGEVPWSITQYSADELDSLLNSRSLIDFVHLIDDNPVPVDKYAIFKYWVDPIANHGPVTFGDPVRIHDFLHNNNLIGSTSRSTVGLVLDWCRNNLRHYIGKNTNTGLDDEDTPANNVRHWGFEGYAPVERIISGTVNPQYPEFGTCHWTPGCWGTTAFLRILLRTVNIPVERLVIGDPNGVLHGTCGFHLGNEIAYLSHGDDPYDLLSKATPSFPAGELLIDHRQFEDWFGSAVPDPNKTINVGRRPKELAIQYLSDCLLADYCDDQAKGLDHAHGQVYQIFASCYDLTDLENNENLWNRMDVKIANFGGCSKIPH